MTDAMGVPSGTKGIVDYVDDAGTIHMKWSNGSKLGLVVGEDDFKIIDKDDIEFENSEMEKCVGLKESPQYRARSSVESQGNKWETENWNATHNENLRI